MPADTDQRIAIIEGDFTKSVLLETLVDSEQPGDFFLVRMVLGTQGKKLGEVDDTSVGV